MISTKCEINFIDRGIHTDPMETQHHMRWLHKGKSPESAALSHFSAGGPFFHPSSMMSIDRAKQEMAVNIWSPLK